MHVIYYNSTGSIPQKILEIKMNDETNRIEEVLEYLHFVDSKDAYLKGIISLQTTFTEHPITHEAWIEMPIKKYVTQVEEARGNPELVLYGTIASILPFYQNFVGLSAKWVLDAKNQIGKIIALTPSKLKEDQEYPISEERIAKMMELVHHPELHKKKKIFKSSFRERLEEMIDEVRTEYIEKNKLFLIDISNTKEVLFQLVPSEMIKNKASGNIGIHIGNDESNENYLIIKSRMDRLCDSDMFTRLVLDDIETYQKNYHFTDSALLKDIKKIVEWVYDENMEEVDLNISEM